jgi:hypothetical protein
MFLEETIATYCSANMPPKEMIGYFSKSMISIRLCEYEIITHTC